ARRTPARIPAVIRRKPRIELARAHELLDDLLFKLEPRTAAMVLDSARHIYIAPDVTLVDKALAAFVIGNANFQATEREKGCDWGKTAALLDPATRSYRDVLAQWQGSPCSDALPSPSRSRSSPRPTWGRRATTKSTGSASRISR